MIKIHRDNRVIFWLLIGGLVLNILWSLRLELQAQSIQTVVDEYHFRLNKRQDVLHNLTDFSREAELLDLESKDARSEFHFSTASKTLNIRSYDNRIQMGMVDGPGATQKLSLQSGPAGKNASIDLSSDEIVLGVNDGSKSELNAFGIDRKKIGLFHTNSKIVVGKVAIKDLGDLTGIKMTGDSTILAMTKEKGTALLDDIGIQLNVSDPNKKDFHLQMMRDEGLCELRHHNSIFRVGKTPLGEGISMGEKDWGTLVIAKDKGIGLVSAKKIILEARGEQAELTIVADGDINIRSKNGVVKINGKKIYMNKEDSQSSGTSDISSPENNLKQSYEKDRNSFNATKIMQTSLKSLGFYNGAVDGGYGPNTKKALQEFLKKEGFYQGRVDGHSGEALRDAIKQYQKSNGLKITGDINLETANAMQR